MEKQKDRAGGLIAQRALQIYVAVCAVLVVVILYGAFERTDGGGLSNEIYLRLAAVERIGN